jgi:transposase InsO family protein
MKLIQDYPARLVCRLLAYPRCGIYRHLRASADDEAGLRQALRKLAGEWPTYGYRRLTALLRRQDRSVNTKRVRRLMKELGIMGRSPRRRPRTTNSNHAFSRYANCVQGLDILRPEQVWVADITYIRLRQEFVYLAVLMDVFTRAIRGWYLSRSLDQELTLTALDRALARRTPEIHHSDQGVQYAATGYVSRLQARSVVISMAAVGEPRENGYAERLMRTIKEEAVDLSEYRDYADAYTQIARFLEAVYNHKRIHSSLGYLTPQEFEDQWLAAS